MDDRFTHLKLEGKLLQAAALGTSYGDYLVVPVEVLKHQTNNFGPPESIYRRKQENRLRSTLRQVGVIERRNKPTQLLPRWTLWRGNPYFREWRLDCFAKPVLIPSATLSVSKKTAQHLALPTDRSRLPAFGFTVC